MFHLFNLTMAILDEVKILYSYYMILGVSGMAMTFWIGIDGKRLEKYADRVKNLDQKLIMLEKKIRTIATRNK